MSTSFFENQDAARRNTTWLVALFGLAVVAIDAMLYLLAAMVTGRQINHLTGQAELVLNWWQPELLLQVSAVTLAVVGLGSLYKISQLRGGGRVVAESLGGTLIGSETRDPEERKILNVVEEMAIAAGVPAPPVYVMENEPGINAFAAGFTPSDAVIGVTRGCVRQLSRDEFQGVIAHEFSHILNGDMSLNIRLMGVLHGILLIGTIGYFLTRSSMYRSIGRRNRDNNGMGMLAIGFGLILIGSVGTLFGNLIKASVSRQREYLADASAVQFTRNPMGIAGALKKIGGYESGSAMESPNAPESSHLFFGQALRGGMQFLFATHPPLEERISRLDPSWQGRSERMPAGTATAGASGFAEGITTSAPEEAAFAEARNIDAVHQIGLPTRSHLEYARKLVADLPAAVLDAAHEPYGARAVIYALLMTQEQATEELTAQTQRAQLARLAEAGERGIDEETRRLLPELRKVNVLARLPLIDIALPALRSLSQKQYNAFVANVQALMDADQRIDLFEWVLQRIVIAHLEPSFRQLRHPRSRYSSLQSLTPECSVVLSVLAHEGSAIESERINIFATAAATLPAIGVELLAREHCGLRELDQSLNKLALAKGQAKESILVASATCIAANSNVSVTEAEILRGIADSLGCPMPPLLPGQPLV
jgi:Zn-dependent protease with chaperone function